MKKNDDVIKARTAYVQKRVNDYQGRTYEIIRILADELFLSIQTIENDLKRQLNDK